LEYAKSVDSELDVSNRLNFMRSVWGYYYIRIKAFKATSVARRAQQTALFRAIRTVNPAFTKERFVKGSKITIEEDETAFIFSKHIQKNKKLMSRIEERYDRVREVLKRHRLERFRFRRKRKYNLKRKIFVDLCILKGKGPLFLEEAQDDLLDRFFYI